MLILFQYIRQGIYFQSLYIAFHLDEMKAFKVLVIRQLKGKSCKLIKYVLQRPVH